MPNDVVVHDPFDSTSPPVNVEFTHTLFVGYPLNSGVSPTFQAIRDAINYLRNLPAIDYPSVTNPYKIVGAPGIFAESELFLPPYVSFEGAGRQLTTIVGSGAGVARITMSAGLGSVISNVRFDSSGYASKVDAQVVFHGDAGNGMIWTPFNQDEYTAVSNGMTLILQTDAVAPVVMTVVGLVGPTLWNATDFSNWINANGGGFYISIVRFGHAVIAQAIPPTTKLTLHKTGTLNACFGFPTVVDTVAYQLSQIFKAETPGMYNFEIDGSLGSGCIYDIYSAAYWNIVDSGSIYSGDNGVWTEFGDLSITSIYIENFNLRGFLVGTSVIKATVLVEADNCECFSIIGGAIDIEFKNAGAYMKARHTTYNSVLNVANSIGVIYPTATHYTEQFKVTGLITAVTYIDGIRPIPHDAIIEGITVSRGTAGAGGSTVIDIMYPDAGNNPVTLYTTAGNRPTIANTAGDRKVLKAKLPDILKLLSGKWISVDVTSVEAGAPADLIVDVHIRVIGRL